MILNALVKRGPGESGLCFGSPAIEVAQDGALLASHDFYYSRDFDGGASETPRRGSFLYRSEDGGASWRKVDCVGVYWGAFFKAGSSVFILGCDRPFGNIVISESEDCGRSWSAPSVLFKGGKDEEAPNYHSSPGSVAIAGGRVFKAFDNVADPAKRKGWSQLAISAPASSCFLDPSSWTASNEVLLEERLLPASWGRQPGAFEWLEGNVVEGPDGEAAVLSCIRAGGSSGFAPMMRVSADGRELSFDPASGFVRLPVGFHKFCVRRCPESGVYLAMGNNNTNPEWLSQRNVLSLYWSKDLLDWRHALTLVKDDSPIPWERSLREIGFQYPDFRIDGEDLVYLLRTAYDGTTWFHDANQVTFHRLEGFRKHLKA